jgi:outer membrane protein assembly factor BamB
MTRAWKSLLALALLGLGGGLLACGGYGPEPVQLAAAIGPSVVSGNHLYAVTASGRLLDVDLAKGEVKDVAAVAGKCKACLDVAGGKVCVASAGRIDLIDTKDGKLLRSLEWTGEVVGVGFVGTGRVFVCGRTSVAVVDLESEKTIHTIDIGGRGGRRIASSTARNLVGTRLYIGSDCEGTVAVLDLENGKVLEQLKIPAEAVGGICVTEDKVFVLGLRYGYGVWTESLGWFDRESKKYTAMKPPTTLLRQSALAAGPNGTLLVAGPEGTFQYDAAGTLIGPLAGKDGSRFVGVWNRHLLLTDAKNVLQAELPRRTAKAN